MKIFKFKLKRLGEDQSYNISDLGTFNQDISRGLRIIYLCFAKNLVYICRLIII